MHDENTPPSSCTSPLGARDSPREGDRRARKTTPRCTCTNPHPQREHGRSSCFAAQLVPPPAGSAALLTSHWAYRTAVPVCVICSASLLHRFRQVRCSWHGGSISGAERASALIGELLHSHRCTMRGDRCAPGLLPTSKLCKFVGAS
ncbi:hypothetical protein PYCCODRAFT_971776 [Trametes coccinea BRFM310]|uniref:Uncharacterized protein n=1 Tax=Trametes coccinea (strain BRFM310) TaxID=1353009 RepID=A0A1Y2IDL3_TRAC3|nr:hypothetical protein PYCCODRAFT_971776 [Trametes coccinea BRFM310]